MRQCCTSIEISDLTGCKTGTYSIITSIVQKKCLISNKNVTSGKHFLADIYLFKVNNRSPRKRCEIYSKLTIKTPERRH